MIYYRLYVLGPTDRICRASEIHCDSDAEAIGIASGLHGGEPMELWNRERLVRRFAPAPAEAVPAA